GGGTGLRGIVAASLGAGVVQTDRHEQALAICARNGARNGVAGVERRRADWNAWEDIERYPLIIGSDILYAEATHAALRHILEVNLASGGRALLADPFRGPSIQFLEQLEAEGWAVSVSTWSVGEEETPRPIGIFELAPPV
ncbi:MAG TPA: hypothetical protein PKD53_03545, partial [Chloroflexaceae bacterium]|nr:hypothetical protein [Chloroflexaceae bacterium]